MSAYQDLRDTLRGDRRTWLVTGAAGFIGSHLCQQLLALDQEVVALDNLATGHRANLAAGGLDRLRFLEGSITDPEVCAAACAGVDHVLVGRSLAVESCRTGTGAGLGGRHRALATALRLPTPLQALASADDR